MLREPIPEKKSFSMYSVQLADFHKGHRIEDGSRGFQCMQKLNEGTICLIWVDNVTEGIT